MTEIHKKSINPCSKSDQTRNIQLKWKSQLLTIRAKFPVVQHTFMDKISDSSARPFTLTLYMFPLKFSLLKSISEFNFTRLTSTSCECNPTLIFNEVSLLNLV